MYTFNKSQKMLEIYRNLDWKRGEGRLVLANL